MTESAWKLGREFTVIAVLDTYQYAFKPSETYKAAPFGQIEIRGKIVKLSPDVKVRLLGVLRWLDEPERISAVLYQFIKEEPKSPFLREFVKSEIGVGPTVKKLPSSPEEWMSFIEENKRSSGVLKADSVLMPDEPIGIRITVDACQEVHGNCRFSRNDIVRGTILVPEEIMATNISRIIEYIRDHLDDLRVAGSINDYYDIEDDEEQDSDWEITESDVHHVFDEYRRWHRMQPPLEFEAIEEEDPR